MTPVPHRLAGLSSRVLPDEVSHAVVGNENKSGTLLIRSQMVLAAAST